MSRPYIAPAGQIADLTGDAAAVIDWLADEAGGQAAFSIGEHWAPYTTEVCDERIRLAAEVLDEVVSAGAQSDIPDCPRVDAATMHVVWTILDRREAAAAEGAARRRREAAERQEAAARDASQARADAALSARLAARARERADTFRRILAPDSGACESERAQAAAHLHALGLDQ